MNAQIYSMNKGAEVAFQYGNSRAIKAKTGNMATGWRCEILKNGEWVARSNNWQVIRNRTQRALAA